MYPTFTPFTHLNTNTFIKQFLHIYTFKNIFLCWCCSSHCTF